MKITATSALVLVALLVSGTATAERSDVTDPSLPRSLPADGKVEVQWTDPAQFSEVRLSVNSYEAKQGDWVQELAQHLRESAEEALPAGQKLDVTITDIDLAGEYAPGASGGAHDVRVMRDVYPPRMTFTFKRTAADGSVIDEGERKLANMSYLDGPAPLGSNEPLRYNKQLIDQWINKEVRKAKKAQKAAAKAAEPASK